MSFVTRSTPLRNPARVTSTPMTTTASMNAVISKGFANSPLNTPSTPEASMPLNVPIAVSSMNASIQPATVV